jgi:hypothetical protein
MTKLLLEDMSLHFPICPTIYGSGPSSSSDVETDDHWFKPQQDWLYYSGKKKAAWLYRKLIVHEEEGGDQCFSFHY